MAITKLTGWAAEAEVMGRLVRVEYAEGRGLLLAGLSDEEALGALDILAAKVIAAVNPAAKLKVKAQPAPTQEEAVQALEKAKVADVEPEAKPKAKEAAKPKAESKPEPVPEPVQEAAAEEAPPEKPLHVLQLAAPEGVAPDIAKAKQLKDVVLILMEHHGIKDVAAMVSKCEELKESVPVLSRIADIPGRVKRTMELVSA